MYELAGQEALFTRPTFSQPCKNVITLNPAAVSLTEPAAHLPTLEFFLSDLISSRKLRKPISRQVLILKSKSVYTKIRQTISLILGVNIP